MHMMQNDGFTLVTSKKGHRKRPSKANYQIKKLDVLDPLEFKDNFDKLVE